MLRTRCRNGRQAWGCGLLGAAAWLLALAPLAALEIDAEPEPAYLAETLRPTWRLVALDEILREIEEDIERPLVLGAQLQAERDARERAEQRDEAFAGETVYLVQRERIALKEVLVLLERAKDLHFTAEPLRLLVETSREHRIRRRRAVNLDMRDYAHGFQPKDFPAPELGFGHYVSRGGGFDVFGGGGGADADRGYSYTLDDFSEMMQVAVGESADDHNFSMTVRSSGNVHLSATPEEELAMRDILAHTLAQRTRRTAWRVSFGLLEADAEPAATGVVPAATAAAVAADLQEGRRLLLTGLRGQLVSAADIHQQAILEDLDVGGSGRLDPVVTTINVGRAAEARVHTGRFFHLWRGEIAWVEQLELQERTVRGPGIAGALEWDLTLEGSVAGLASDERPADDEDEPERGVDLDGDLDAEHRPAAPGEALPLQFPTLWSWQPPVDVMLPAGSGLVLVAEHPRGTAVIVLEEVQP